VDSRTRLAIGGMATVAASVAVVCVVAMTSSIALADAAGAPIGSRPVVVPSATSSATPTPSRSAVPPHAQVPVVVDEPETVPAPEPEDVAASQDSSAEATEPSAAVEDALVAAVAAAGSWDAARLWAEQQGWPAGRVDAWIERLAAKLERTGATAPDRLASVDAESDAPIKSQNSAKADKASGRDLSGSSSGSKREQSRVPPG
jgi:hypothetical protein